MARIRSIKPDAFTSDTLSLCSILARWTFAGLWTYCDDYGRGRYDVRLIKAALFPLDDSTTLQNVRDALDELVEADDALCLYEANGRQYLHLPKWGAHQKVSHPTDSKIPECPRHPPEDSGGVPEKPKKPRERLRPEQGTGNREQGKHTHPLPDTWKPTDNHRIKAEQLELNLDQQADAFRDHFKATGKKYIDWDAAFSGWMRRSAQWSDGGPKAPVESSPRRHLPVEVPDHIDPNDTAAYARWAREAAQ